MLALMSVTAMIGTLNPIVPLMTLQGKRLAGRACIGFRDDYLGTEMDEEDNEECLKELKRIIAKSACYGDHNVVLIGGKDYSESGWDDGEQIIPNAKILAIINK